MTEPRTTVLTGELLRAMTRDAARLLLTARGLRPLWAAIALGAAAGVALAVLGDRRLGVALVVWAGALAGVLVLRARGAAVRSLSAAYPPGATVTVRYAPDGLHVEGPLRTTRTSWDLVDDVRVHRSVAVLRHRGSRLATVVPRALMTDEDHAQVLAYLG